MRPLFNMTFHNLSAKYCLRSTRKKENQLEHIQTTLKDPELSEEKIQPVSIGVNFLYNIGLNKNTQIITPAFTVSGARTDHQQKDAKIIYKVHFCSFYLATISVFICS